MLALIAAAAAATVAVLDFDGYGVPHPDAQTLTEQVRDAFLAEGLLDPLSGSDIADLAARGQESTLRKAREALAQGRARLAASDPPGAVAALRQAVELHRAARSDVGRRSEIADAWWLLGLALLRAGLDADADAAFAGAAQQYPGYVERRASEKPADAVARFARAEAALDAGAPRAPEADDIGRLGAAMSTDYVVTGFVRADGKVKARIWQDGVVVGEGAVTLATMPPDVVDPAYADLARALAGAAAGDAPAAEPPSDLVEATEPVPEPLEPAASEAGPQGAALDTPKPSISRPSTIKGTKPAPRADGAVTDRWWFWTVLAALTTGAGVGIGVALYEPAPIVEELPDAWALTVEVP